MIRKINIILIISLLCASLFINNVYASKKDFFVVTAYYSPLPNQEYYLTGDYESEKRLNGQGIRGASGKPVFSGMLAAPKNFKFGSKIYLEGLGIGEVSDRGGAIVNAGNRGYSYDRIDIWVGYGDEGLRRALYWGKRTIKGNFVNENTKVTLNFKSISSPIWATKGLKRVPSIFNEGIGVKSKSESIKNLQKFLKDISFYNGKINGIYNNEIIDNIYKFQLKNNIIKEGDLYGAGYWGKSTRSLFLKKYLNGEFDKIVKNNSNKDNNIGKIDIYSKALTTKKQKNKLLNILNTLGYNSILNFQISNDVIENENSLGANNYGPKTRIKLKEVYNNYLDEEKRKEELEKKLIKLEELSFKKAEEKIQNIGNPKFGEVSYQVRELQIALKKLGYFNYSDTAIYGSFTKKSIISYQIAKKLISNNNDLGAGLIGPKTKNALKNDLKKYFLNKMILFEKINKDELVNI